MLEKALEKLKAEMDQNKNNDYVQCVGEFLINHLKENPADGEKILSEGKTITKSYDEIEKEARKKTKKNRAVIIPQEGFYIVMKYFGIKSDFSKVNKISETKTETPSSEVKIKTQEKIHKSSIDFDVNLDELL
jgi:hypothetical protein